MATPGLVHGLQAVSDLQDRQRMQELFLFLIRAVMDFRSHFLSRPLFHSMGVQLMAMLKPTIPNLKLPRKTKSQSKIRRSEACERCIQVVRRKEPSVVSPPWYPRKAVEHRMRCMTEKLLLRRNVA